MKSTVNPSNRLTVILVGVLLAFGTVIGLTGWQLEHDKVLELEAQIAELEKQEKRSAVLRSVSSQLEEIASEQRAISDEQRVEAQKQTQLAYEERQKALLSEQQAKTSELRAKESERLAQDARLTAERQQLMAEHQRIQAELARSVADTLRYQALGRSLGSLSTTQHKSGNKEMAELLAYAAYVFTNRYNGDLYNPAVLQALMMASQSIHTWPVHNGVITGIDFAEQSNSELATVSNFGEIIRHHYEHGQLTSTVLLRDSNYDFRNVIYSRKGSIMSISHQGQFVVFPKNDTMKEIQIRGVEKPSYLSFIDDDHVAVIGTKEVTFVDLRTYRQVKTRNFDFTIIAAGRNHHHPLIFDDRGYMHEIVDLNRIETKKVPVSGKVTAYANSANAHIDAYGMSDGTIYIVDENGRQNRLVGHRSRISRLKLNGTQLYSSSYDGLLNLWMISTEKGAKIDPMNILNANNWIMYFTSDNAKQNIWISEQKGNLTMVLTSIKLMVNDIKSRLKRDLTQQEWDYYIGKSVPFESFISPPKPSQREGCLDR